MICLSCLTKKASRIKLHDRVLMKPKFKCSDCNEDYVETFPTFIAGIVSFLFFFSASAWLSEMLFQTNESFALPQSVIASIFGLLALYVSRILHALYAKYEKVGELQQ